MSWHLSLPLWERGLKSESCNARLEYDEVAPLVGAWIEIFFTYMHETGKMVAPLVGAWIEILLIPGFMTAACVAPLVGAWIEIDVYDFTDFRVNVAPLVGAWIEMPWWERGSSCKASLPLWERGLKYLAVRITGV